MVVEQGQPAFEVDKKRPKPSEKTEEENQFD